MGTPDDKIAQMGLELPPLQQPVANYVPAVQPGNLLFLAGAGPAVPPGGKMLTGKLGRDLSVDEATRQLARWASFRLPGSRMSLGI